MYVFGSWWRRRRGDEWKRGLGFGFTNPVGTERVFDVSLGCGGVGGVGEKWVGAWTRVWRGSVM